MVVVALIGCDRSFESPDAQTIDAPDRCSAVSANATLSSSAVIGPTNELMSTISFAPTRAGDTIVLAMFMANGIVEPSVPNGGVGGIAAQVGTCPACGCGVIHSFGNVDAGVDSVVLTGMNDVGSSVRPTYTAYALVFSGLRADAGARLQPYGTSIGAGEAADIAVRACPGSAVVSLIVSCETQPQMSPTSPFVAVDARDSSGVAYFVPASSGDYGALWSLPGGAHWGVATASFQ